MAGVECAPKVSPSKRKAAESLASEERSLEERASKRIDCSEAEKEPAAPAVADDEGEEAPAKKMWRLPQEEVDWILAQSNEPVCSEFRGLKRANLSLVPSPEEEKDEFTVLLYDCARLCYEDEAKFAKFQAWVRREYASKDSWRSTTTTSVKGPRHSGI
ncbi:hypothetical protein PVAP13_1KG291400 [Panicum virgatum]|uniref:Uncharacterized protein n=1 Tax=Panicum virgatum TaxID=38727 RepID=A0A8T0XT44_PANVG|nr:hypothetical protein PVAP13_1KG291400 [Panicum virgatum]